METLRQAICLGDTSALQKAAHSLKSASGNLGAITLVEICKELESMGRAGTMEKGSSLLSEIEVEYKRVCEGLEKELN
jgi:two-component system sensor histidine kinase/response regulator